eukprot:Nitzschia sp. Nitz4//scaffold208_size52459//19609//21669//NITZ4_006811-RA/size52459-processed-gene-0.31-mRNA-1//-1//CDS//3329541654//9052//frame0
MSTSTSLKGAQQQKKHEDVIRPLGYYSADCGYCKGQRASLLNPPKSTSECSKSFGILADSLSPRQYEGLIHRGWRRSGVHLYKPSNFESCCPAITIRLFADQFKPSKSQAKLTRKMNHLLQNPTDQAKNENQSKASKKGNSSTLTVPTEWKSVLERENVLSVLSKLVTTIVSSSDLVASNESARASLSQTNSTLQYNFKIGPPSKSDLQQRTVTLSSTIAAQLAGRCKMDRDLLVNSFVASLRKELEVSPNKFHQVKIESVVAHAKSGQLQVKVKIPEESLAEDDTPMPDALHDTATTATTESTSATDGATDNNDKLGQWYLKTVGKPLHPEQRKLTMETIPAHVSALDPEVHRLYVRYQHVVHQDPDPFQTLDVDTTTTTATTTTTTAVTDAKGKSDASSSGHIANPMEAISQLEWGNNPPAHFCERVQPMLRDYLEPYSKAAQSELLKSYDGFYQFLVESPFDYLLPADSAPAAKPASTGSSKTTTYPCGCYHQQYRIGEALIAVGVVDVLPQGFSSVYLYYDPDFSHSLVALGKLAILKEIEFCHKTLAKPFYYLGYYIESCPKMRYKAEYQPSQLLCPINYKWVDCSIAIPKLQQVPLHVCELAPATTTTKVEDNSPVSKRLKTPDTGDAAFSNVFMEIGAGVPVTLDMLQEDGKDMVRPFLQDLTTEIGNELLRKMLVQLV